MKVLRIPLCCAALLLSCWMVAPAQESRATLRVRVFDSASATVPNATVTVVNQQTLETAETKTSADGLAVVNFLKPGAYNISIEASGFRKHERKGVPLDLGQVSQIDVRMEVGALADSITVTAEAPLLDNINADRGQVIDSNLSLSLPLVNRNVYQVIYLTAGVTFNGWYVWLQPYQQNAMEKVSISGGLNAANEYVLDGAPNAVYNQGAILAGSNPPLDAISEFKVQTNIYDPQYGNTSGGVINMTTKSGTSDLHGAVWEFARRTSWNANSFMNNAAGRANASQRIDQYGFEIDGPVWLPKLYEKRHKTFFMASMERYRQTTPGEHTTSVPEPEMLSGDFSRLTNAAGQQIKIYDPLAGSADANGNWLRAQFPNNRIPADRINPITKAILSYMPKPNQPSASRAYSFDNLYLSGGAFAQSDRFWDYIVRGDHNFNDNQRVFARWHDAVRNQFSRNNGILSGPGQTGNNSYFQPSSGSIDWVGTFGPTLVANARATYSYYRYDQTPMDNLGFDKSKLGFPSSLLGMIPGPALFGQYGFSGYAQLGQNWFGYHNRNYNFQGNVTKVKGAHTLKAGADFRNIQYGQVANGCYFCMNFDANFTKLNYLDTRDALSGNSIASALLGYPSGESTQLLALPFISRKYFATYIGDDWKVTRRLTVNLGFRYDVYVPFKERYNRLNVGLDTTRINPIDQQVDHGKLPNAGSLYGVMQFAGRNGAPAHAADIYNQGLEPRFGFAYELSSRIVLRGGYGHSHFDQYADFYSTQGFDAVNTNAVTSNDSGKTPAPNVLVNPWPSGTGAPVPVGPLTYLGRGLSVWQPNFKTPYVKQFSLGVQVGLPFNSKLEAAYQGSRGNDLRMSQAFNEPSLAVRQQCDALEGGTASYCDAQVANPFYQLAPFAGQGRGTNPTLTRWELSRPYAQFGGLTNNSSNGSRTWYNSLQTTYEVRGWKGLNTRAAFTWSKMMEQWGLMDVQNGIYQVGPNNASVPLSFRVMTSYDLPFGPNKSLLKSSHPVVQRLAGGWQYNAIWNWNGGFPMDNNSGVLYLRDAQLGKPDWSGSGQFVRVFKPCAVTIPNAAGSPATMISHGAYDQQFGCTADNPNWAISPKYGPASSAPYRNGQMMKPPYSQVDMSVNKMTRIAERVSLQFRAEVQNIFNHFNYPKVNPVTNPNDPLFGMINKNTVSETNAGLPRQIQLGMKLIW